jgi:hypothetical protein
MAMEECVDTLLVLQAATEIENASQFSVVGTKRYHDVDEALVKVTLTVSPHAFELIREQYKLVSSGEVSDTVCEIHATAYQLISSRTLKTYRVRKEERTVLIDVYERALLTGPGVCLVCTLDLVYRAKSARVRSCARVCCRAITYFFFVGIFESRTRSSESSQPTMGGQCSPEPIR